MIYLGRHLKKYIIIILLFISKVFSQSQFTGELFWGLNVDRQTDAIYTANNIGSGFVIKSTDLGDNWQIVTSNLNGNCYSLVYAQNESVITASGSYAYRIEAGFVLDFINELEYPFTISTFLDPNGNIYIGNCVFGGSTGSLYGSSDYGISWNKVTSLPTISVVESMLFMIDRTYISTQDDGIYCSSDNGISWGACNVGLPYLKNSSIAKQSNNTLYVIVQTSDYSKANLYKSTDLGTHWVQASYYEINGYVAKLFINSADILFCNENESILYSTDNGVNWKNKNVGSEIYNFAETSTGFLIASGTYGIFISEDNGISWIYKPITNTIVGNDIPQIKKEKYFLYNNYPNPFNPKTTLRFSLAESGRVRLDLYDVQGRMIKTLLNEYRNSGTYELGLNICNQPSGVYIYKITSGKYENSKKMILLK